MTAPIVELNDVTVFLGGSIAAAEFFSATDPDDQIVEYFFDDFRGNASTGYFEVDGVPQLNGGTFSVAAEDLDKVRYIGGSEIFFEGFKIIARDQAGQFSSPLVRGRVYSVQSNTSTPHVRAPRISVLANEVLQARDFITGYDPDGYPIVEYYITEGTKLNRVFAANDIITVVGYKHHFTSGDEVTISGANESQFNTTGVINVIDEHVFAIYAPGVAAGEATGNLFASSVDGSYFELNGEKLTEGQRHRIPAEELDNLVYRGSGRTDSESFYVQGFDGVDFSFEKRGFSDTIINANIPVVPMTRARVRANEFLSMEGQIDVIDADGNTPKLVRFLNTSPHGQKGDLFRDNVVMPRQAWFEVPADELDRVTFYTEEIFGQQQIAVRVYDGLRWSATGTLVIDTLEPLIQAQIASTTGVIVTEQLEPLPVGPLFTKIDEGKPHVSVQIFEPSLEPESGAFRFGSTPLQAGVIHDFTEAEFQNAINFYTGDFLNRHIDPLYVRKANEDGIWSRWEKVEIRTEPEVEDVLSSGLDWLGILPRNPITGKLDISYSFMQQFPDYETGEADDDDFPEHFSEFTQHQRENVRRVFRDLEELVNIQFTEVQDSELNILGQRGGVMRFGEYGEDDSNAAAFAFLPSTAPQGGDQWFNRLTMNTQNMAPRSFGYAVLLHELGHALGLKHPHAGIPTLPPNTDVSDFTVMSYVDGPNGQPTSYQLYDIYELQQIYGINTDTRTGDNTYAIWSTFEGSQTPFETLWDAGGEDTLSANGSAASAILDLRQGQHSTIGTLNRNVAIAFGTEIENAIGSSHDDELIGNGADNVLIGRLGNDYLWGNHGADFLQGGEGDDTYEWGIGDGNDIIDEEGLAGRDTLTITRFPLVGSLPSDFAFHREGEDVIVSLALDNGPVDNTMRIKNQVRGGYRVETLEFAGVQVDMANLTSYLVDGAGLTQFDILPSSSEFGHLVTPV